MRLFDQLVNLLFPGNQYGTRTTTRQGVEVRSRAERQIADYFAAIGLRYEYEKELAAGFWIFLKKVSCPDFYLPDHDIYVEYWGLLKVEDDHDRSKYERSMKYKMARYRQLGIKFISLYPDDLKNLDEIFRKRFKEVVGREIPQIKRSEGTVS